MGGQVDLLFTTLVGDVRQIISVWRPRDFRDALVAVCGNGSPAAFFDRYREQIAVCNDRDALALRANARRPWVSVPLFALCTGTHGFVWNDDVQFGIGCRLNVVHAQVTGEHVDHAVPVKCRPLNVEVCVGCQLGDGAVAVPAEQVSCAVFGAAVLGSVRPVTHKEDATVCVGHG